MRRIIGNIFFLIFLFGFAYFFREPLLHTWRQIVQRTFPCQQPIAYSIGVFDERFGISKESFLKNLEKAESVWEKPFGKDLFVYVPDGALKINLEFDDRQASTQKLQELGLSIHDDQASYDALKVQYDSLKKKIDAEKTTHQIQSDQYDERLTIYNKEVNYWNKQKQVSPEVAARLSEEKRILDEQFSVLKDLQNKINANVDALNAFAEVINRLARSLNLAADQYNTVGAEYEGEFEEGEYVSASDGNRITIYQFDDQTKLTRVLIHEMGHALGLDHVEDEKAIMYRLNNGVNTVLTEEDLRILKKQCRIQS